ncbi:hypothetical protein BJ170DRAFT_630521 [Xylariales sp. AK1849]|nr:hypothetical protein BJ170DRAFT_630521 [Xylariales sp. AK1849]
MTPGKNVVSVKGGCIEGLNWNKAIHIWTKSAMVPIPEGCESHPEEPSDSDYSGSQEFLDQPVDPPGLLTGSGGSVDSMIAEEAAEFGQLRAVCDFSGT